MLNPKLFTASYTRADDLVMFEYEIELADTPVDSDWTWVARVSSDGTFKGRTTGVMPEMVANDPALESTVCNMVEGNIRKRHLRSPACSRFTREIGIACGDAVDRRRLS